MKTVRGELRGSDYVEKSMESEEKRKRESWFYSLGLDLGWGWVALIEYVALFLIYPDVNSFFGYMQFDISATDVVVASAFGGGLFMMGAASPNFLSRINIMITTVPTVILFQNSTVGWLLLLITLTFQIFLCFFDGRFKLLELRPSGSLVLKKYIKICLLFLLFLLVYFRNLVSFDSLLDVYDNRQIYKEAVGESAFLRYSKLLGKLVIIIPSIYAYYDRKYYLVALVFSFTLYLVFSSKFMLFLPILIWVVPYAISRAKFCVSVFVGLLLVWLFSLGTNFGFYFVGIVRRALFLPSLLNEIYARIYQELGAQFFRNTIFSFLNPNPIEIPRLANYYLMGHELSHANTGIIGSSVVQLGIVGPFFYGMIYIFLVGLNKGYRQKDRITWGALTAFSLTALGVSDISTTLVLHGGLIMCLVFRFSKYSFGRSSF